MFNVYKLDKQILSKEMAETRLLKKIIYTERKKKNDKQLSENYRQRMNDNMVNIAINLQEKIPKRPKSEAPTSRSWLPYKTSTTERIKHQEIIEKNK